MPRDGRPPTIDPVWAMGLKDRGWSSDRIAEEVFKEKGKRVTKRAVDLAIHNYKAKAGKPPSPEWPWKLLARHCQGPLYDLLLSVRYWELGAALLEAEQRAVRDFLRMMDQQGVVVAYNRQSGFHFAARQPEDDASYFQERSFSADGQLLVG